MVRIAVLEYELFGIEPKPGSLAAALIGLNHLSGAVVNGIIDFPPGTPRRETDLFRTVWQRNDANSFPFQKADGSIEIVCQDPSAAHLDRQDNRG
ncbi:hypothetical protein N4G70_28900 [Streptomyces sp. ASQP_92]|uniref:hypothetical protein n=1 Tax=Streptomyces sp. ASQP_92 TaxID=2979116 RepID=UPI0021BECF8A|nr:hypothetical protein [Streptomyces sp. ASQP_92]MCT9092859.1 hypothetical protein [Streptomyces sp. ASQP_92]